MLISILTFLSGAAYVILNVAPSGNFPSPLPKAEETALFEKLKSGDMNARERLIEHNLRLVSHVVRKYYGANRNQDDLISIGTIGLIKSVDSFNPDNGARFATYAAKCIQNEILMHFRTQKKLSQEVSINETIDMDKDGNPLTYIDIIRVEDTIADDIDTKIKTDRAMEFIRTNLDRREKQIISMRYGLGKNAPITQREVAAKLGISRSYISRIEKSALAKISEYLK